MMTRGRGGVTIPPKNDDVIYEQPLITAAKGIQLFVINVILKSVLAVLKVGHCERKSNESIPEEGRLMFVINVILKSSKFQSWWL